MLNFKSLILTTVAALGLAANVQACPICHYLSPSTPANMCSFAIENAIEYARTNADVLLQEYERVLNDPQTIVRAKEIIHGIFNSMFNLEKQIIQSKCKTNNELFIKNLTFFDAVVQKATDARGWADAIFPAQTTPCLNKLAHDSANIFVIPFIQNKIAPQYMTHEMLPYQARLMTASAEIKAKLLEFNDKTRNPGFLAAADILCEFPARNKELCLQLGRALHAVLKDEAFWAGHSNTSNGFPTTNSSVKLQEVIKALQVAFGKTMRLVGEKALSLHYQHEELMCTGKLELSLINH